MFEVTDDDLIGDVSRCGREVAPCPEALAPEAFADVFELLLDFARRAPLGLAHEIAYPHVGRYLDEQVDVILRQRPADDRHPHFAADLTDNLAHPQPDLAVEHLEPIFRRPDNMIAMVKKCVTAAAIGHSL